ncbi:MAG: DUF302 domain-containing protein [Chthoniobacteraceae bacterium]
MKTSIDGLTTLPTNLGAKETMNRLEAEIRAQGMEVFARIDHAAAAAKAGLPLAPTELIIFGSPRAGTPLMQIAQTAGIDLPLKALAWQDAAGQSWLSYTEPGWIAQRHGVGAEGDAVAKRIAAVIGGLANKATEAPHSH